MHAEAAAEADYAVRLPASGERTERALMRGARLILSVASGMAAGEPIFRLLGGRQSAAPPRRSTPDRRPPRLLRYFGACAFWPPPERRGFADFPHHAYMAIWDDDDTPLRARGMNGGDLGVEQAIRERLSALDAYGILDTPAEEDFDDITKIAASVCDAPIAVINLLARDRQWFKSEVGLGVCETPIDVSICASAVLQSGDLFVVTDLTQDARFAANPLVTGAPHLRFYAGARLMTPSGVTLGTVCVLDSVVRADGLNATQAMTLRALARQTMAMLELRRAVEEREMVQRELSHRVKNVFALVSSLAQISARKFPEAKPFAADFSERVSALSRAHDLLLERETRGDDQAPRRLEDLLNLMLAPFGDGESKRWRYAGDAVAVGPQATESLVLFVHEMATNAAKYGALSVPDGRIEVTARVTGGEVALEWRERGGPHVGAPVRTGFGAKLIAQMTGALGSTMTRDWEPEGLKVTLDGAVSRFAR